MGAKRMHQAEHAIERGGGTALLLARLVPLAPYSLVGHVAGAARVPLWRFVQTDVIGMLQPRRRPVAIT
jgi:membrane protein DedA with SNARE-associated domain